MPYVISKLSADVEYTAYQKGEGGIMRVVGRIKVRGGAGVADKRTLITPAGVVTELSADEVKKLQSDPVFKQHEAAGVVEIVLKKPEDPEKVAATLERDESAPLTPNDYEAEGKEPPVTGDADKVDAKAAKKGK